jgi:hypothetical protein
MWKCSKCGRQFKNMEQDHFCVKPNSIDEYIAAQQKDMQPLLQSIRVRWRLKQVEGLEWQNFQPKN